jgi:tetratricopeptide (TPR) repeat protein
VIKTDDSVANVEPTAVQASDAVVVDFVGRLAADKNDENGPIFHQAKDWLVVVGEKDVLPVLEMGIRFMQVGQRAVVWSHSKYAYGPSSRKHGDYELPPDSCVRYEVTVKSVFSSDPIVNDPLFQIKIALSKKRIGNDIYANEWSDGYGKQRAKLLYKRAGDMMEYLVQTLQKKDDENDNNENDKDKATRKEAFEIMLDCQNNIAACHLRAKEFHQAKEAAVKVLGHDPDNLKGLIRAARAALLDPASSFEEVEAAIAAAEMDHPKDPEVRKLRIELKQRMDAYRKKTKEMFSKSGKNRSTNTSTNTSTSTSTSTSTTTTTATATATATTLASKNEQTMAALVAAEEQELQSTTGGATKQAEADTDIDIETPPTPWWRKNWRQWEWKNIILPYSFQLLLPFFMYYAFTVMKKKEALILQSMQQEQEATTTMMSTPLDEFSDMPGGSEL